MKTMIVMVIIVLAGWILVSGVGAAEGDFWPEVQTENRPGCMWWWQGSAVDKENITWNLETMRQAGIGGVTIVPIYGVKGEESKFIPYLTPKWVEMMDHTVAEGKRLDMWVDMTTGTGWPLGGPGVEEADADCRLKNENGQLAGRYSGMKVKRAAPGSEGRVLNPFSVKAMDKYLTKFTPVFSRPGQARPRAQYHDSFEYQSNWSGDFLEEFQVRRGYDLQQYAAQLSGQGDGEQISRIKSDYRQTLAELHLGYVRRWAEWAGQLGMQTRNQAHGAPGNLLDLYAAAEIAETETFGSAPFAIPGLRREPDNVRPDIPEPLVLKFASSAAHVAGRRLASSETSTWLRNHFTEALSQIKPEIDQLFVMGINHIIYHGCCYSPQNAEWPGWLFYASTEYNPRNTLWRDLPQLNQYITRCQSILQSAKPANDILLYWPIYDLWSDPNGLNKNMTVHHTDWINKTAFGATAAWLLERGYNFDYVSDAQVQKIALNGETSYRAILVPACTYMPAETLNALVEAACNGTTVLFEKLPADVPGLGRLEERREVFKEALDQLASKADGQAIHLGKGLAYELAEREELLALGKVRPEPFAAAGLRFIRLKHDEGYYYFLANLGGKLIGQWFAPAVALRAAVIMNPLTGEVRQASLRQPDNRSEIYLELKPGESCFVKTFDSRKIELEKQDYFRVDDTPLPIAGLWRVEFVDGGPEMPEAYQTQELASWTARPDDKAKRFAGAARYTIEFDLPVQDVDNWILDPGLMRESARVTINGREAGTFWSLPYEMLVGHLLKPGKNTLTLEVTNLAINRIRDLDIRQVNWKKFYDINIVDLNYKPFDASGYPLAPSGLLGPVVLKPAVRVAPMMQQ